MYKNLLLALFAGLFFGVWPLLMNRSNLTGYLSACVFVLFSLIIVTPFALSGSLQSLYTADWKYAICAGITGAIGLLAFTTLLSNNTPQQIAPLFIITLLAQVLVPAVYDAVLNGNFTKERLIGLMAAVVAVFYLNK